MDKERINRAVKLWGVTVSICMFAILLDTWYFAFLSGNDRVTITIAEYGEKYPELIIVPVAFAFALWGSIAVLIDLCRIKRG